MKIMLSESAQAFGRAGRRPFIASITLRGGQNWVELTTSTRKSDSFDYQLTMTREDAIQLAAALNELLQGK